MPRARGRRRCSRTCASRCCARPRSARSRGSTPRWWSTSCSTRGAGGDAARSRALTRPASAPAAPSGAHRQAKRSLRLAIQAEREPEHRQAAGLRVARAARLPAARCAGVPARQLRQPLRQRRGHARRGAAAPRERCTCAPARRRELALELGSDARAGRCVRGLPRARFAHNGAACCRCRPTSGAAGAAWTRRRARSSSAGRADGRGACPIVDAAPSQEPARSSTPLAQPAARAR